MKCNTCKQQPICKIYDYLNQYSFAISLEINRCTFYQENSRSISNSDNISIEKVSSLKDKVNNMLYSEDTSSNSNNKETLSSTNKIKCDSCHRYFQEYDITETLSGRKLCPDCYEKDSPTIL